MSEAKIKTDAGIVKLCLKDNIYFEQLIDRYEHKLLRYIQRISSVSKETAEDLLQEVFIKVYRNLNDFDDQFSFSSWIYRITHNTVVSHAKKMNSTPVSVSIHDDDFDQSYVKFLSKDFDIPEKLDREKRADIVRKALLELPDKYREVLVLYYLEGKSYKEISDILEKSINSVSVLINRAKDKLKNKLHHLNFLYV